MSNRVEALPGKPSRSRSFRILLALVPALAFIAILWFALARTGSQAVSGNAAPSFELELLDGSGVLTDEKLKGKPVVINFWASWCIPCREEAPLLEKTWRAYKNDGVIFLGVNIKDAESDAKRFVDEFGITYPTVRDLDQSLTKDFGVKGLPETFFVDHRWTFIGAISGAQAGDQQGTVVLGAISEDELVSNIEILIRRAASAGE
ncbi:MAG: redoxin domain-containing protein [Actinomycetota bacterium]|jgi:cytochrome c biogenesis protein CcmG/thiol:disulfide interchange protein DsbE|nr:redoxin domain-containing protein [Actinomycetota bacterium]